MEASTTRRALALPVLACVLACAPEPRPGPAWRGGGLGPAGADDQLYALLPGAGGTVVGVGFRGLAEDARSLVLRWTGAGELDGSLGAVVGARGDLLLHGAVDAQARILGAGMTVRGNVIQGLIVRFAPPAR